MLAINHPHGSFIFVFEGVLMYFPEDQVKAVIINLSRYFPNSEIHFDVVSKWMSRQSHRHDTVKYVKAKFRWGMDNATDAERRVSNIKHQETFYYMDYEKQRWGIKWRIISMIPAFRNASFILHYDVVGEWQKVRIR